MEFEHIRWSELVEVKRLPSGGMAELFLVERVQGDFRKFLVLKRIHERLADEANTRALFTQEACLHARFDHPHVVQLLDFGSDNRFLYMALEYVNGGDLFSLGPWLKKQGETQRVNFVLEAFTQMASALVLVHQHAIHHDLSPSNILYSERGSFKLCDFGLAKAIGQKPGPILMGQGKFRYMSPEQICGSPTDARSDIFSLGATMAEFYAGEKLYGDLTPSAFSRLIRNGDYLKYFSALKLPKGLDEIILRTVQPSQGDRYQSSEVLLRDLSAERARLTLVQTPTPTSNGLTDVLPCRNRLPARGWSKVISVLLTLPLLFFLPWFAQWRKAGRRSR
jgi:serine/threonine protein kinase